MTIQRLQMIEQPSLSKSNDRIHVLLITIFVADTIKLQIGYDSAYVKQEVQRQ